MANGGPAVRRVSRRAGLVRMVGLDLVGPLLVYRLSRDAGVPVVWALVLSGAPPALGVLADWLRWRTLEIVGAVVLGGIALSVVLAFVSGDPKVVLLEGAATTAAFGVFCFLSLLRRRPLIFYFAQAFYGGRHSAEGGELEAEHDAYAGARSFWRKVTAVWGAARLLEAAVLVLVVEAASVPAALAFNRTAPWLVFGGLFAWTLWWGGRQRDGAAPAGTAGAPAAGAPEA